MLPDLWVVHDILGSQDNTVNDEAMTTGVDVSIVHRRTFDSNCACGKIALLYSLEIGWGHLIYFGQ